MTEFHNAISTVRSKTSIQFERIISLENSIFIRDIKQ